MNNNPSAGNKAGGLTTVLEKPLGRHCASRVYQSGRSVRICPADHGARTCFYGHARLRPGVGYRPGSRRGESDLFHDGTWFSVRLRPGAVRQTCDEHSTLATTVRRYGPELRRGVGREDDDRAIISEKRGEPFELQDIPAEDSETYRMICRADTWAYSESLETFPSAISQARLQPRFGAASLFAPRLTSQWSPLSYRATGAR
jgi:hypothetical protein